MNGSFLTVFLMRDLFRTAPLNAEVDPDSFLSCMVCFRLTHLVTEPFRILTQHLAVHDQSASYIHDQHLAIDDQSASLCVLRQCRIVKVLAVPFLKSF